MKSLHLVELFLTQSELSSIIESKCKEFHFACHFVSCKYKRVSCTTGNWLNLAVNKSNWIEVGLTCQRAHVFICTLTKLIAPKTNYSWLWCKQGGVFNATTTRFYLNSMFLKIFDWSRSKNFLVLDLSFTLDPWLKICICSPAVR